MHWAADRNQLKVAEVLLKAGLDPLIEGRVSFTAGRLDPLIEGQVSLTAAGLDPLIEG